ncbi:hypothetical protein ACFW04_013066 [Cataglyphis niger]
MCTSLPGRPSAGHCHPTTIGRASVREIPPSHAQQSRDLRAKALCALSYYKSASENQSLVYLTQPLTFLYLLYLPSPDPDRAILRQRSGKTDRYTYVVSEIANISDDNLKSYFASWALQHQISHTALSALLQRLRNHSCFSSLSLDACSLLKTLRKQEMHTIVPGTYYHFELQKSVLNILISIKSNVDSIETAINLDGLPLSKSSQHFWLTLGSIMPYNNVFAIGIYYGTEKPANVDDFLKDLNPTVTDFVDEAIEMCKNGIYVNGDNIQSKAFVLCIKGHSGYSSCTKYDDDFIQKIDDSYHKPNIICSLLKIPHFNLLQIFHSIISTEYRLILLYTGPLAFKSILKKTSILRTKSDYFFIKTFIELYGVQNISHIIHSLIHLVDNVKKFGSLDNFSASNTSSIDSVLIYPTLMSLHNDSPFLSDCNNSQYKIIKYCGITFQACK